MVKNPVIVAAAQVDLQLFDASVNLAVIESRIRQAKEEKNADLVVFPELSNIGYISQRDKEFGLKYLQAASTIPGDFTDALGELARKYDVHIICGMAELHPVIPGTLYNSAVLLDRQGQIVGVHRKAQIPGYEKHYFIPSQTNNVFDTELGKIGIGICYDNQFCEFTRTLAVKGAEILVMLWNMPKFSNAPEMLYHLTATRAFENRFYAVSCNRLGENNGIGFFGHSCISNPLGELMAQAEEEDCILYATIDRDVILRERAQMPIFRDRRPDLYGELVKPL